MQNALTLIHSTAQHSTAQHSTAQHSTAQQDNCAFFSFIRNLNRQVRERHALLPGGFFCLKKGTKCWMSIFAVRSVIKDKSQCAQAYTQMAVKLEAAIIKTGIAENRTQQNRRLA